VGSGAESPTSEPLAEQPTAEPPAPGRAHLRVLTGGRAASAVPEAASEVTVDDHSDTESSDTPAPVADFRVRCPDCGPQYVAVADVRFVSTGGGAETDRYLFTCPSCGTRVRRPAGPELAEILRTSGVATLALRRGPDQAL
jgi:hypothetical protein